MQKYKHTDHSDVAIEKLRLELKNKLNAPGLRGFLFDDDKGIREVLRYAYAVGYDEGFIDRSGARRVEQVNEAGQVIEVFRSVQIAAEHMGVSTGSIHESLRNKNRRCKGYSWRYKKS